MLDVIVVGAGPSGSLAASRLASMGHEVLLLDSASKIGDKLCTGVVSAKCAREFDVPLDLLWHRGQSLTLYDPAGDPIRVLRDDEQAMVIDRGEFVRSIAREASRQGARVLFRRRVVDLFVDDKGVRVDSVVDGNRETFHARSLVIANGFKTKLAAKAGLVVPEASAYGAQAEATNISLNETKVFVRRIVPKSYFGWMVPTGNDTAHIGLLGRGRPLAPFQEFVRGVQEMGYEFDLVDRPGVWGVPLKASTRSYSTRCLLVGDAAGHIKPTTGGGIYFGMKGAEIAAEVLSNSLHRNDLSARSLQVYEKRWKEMFGREIKMGHLARLFYERMGDADVTRVLRTAEERGFLDEHLSFDSHGEIIKRVLDAGIFLPIVKNVVGVTVGSIRN